MQEQTVDIIKEKERKAEVLRQVGIAATVCLPKGTELFLYGSQANQAVFKPADIDLGLLWESKISYNALADFMMMLDALPPFTRLRTLEGEDLWLDARRRRNLTSHTMIAN